jgi:hypothetical protein
MIKEFKISERQLNYILESMGRIDTQVMKIKEGNTITKKTKIKRLDVILDKTLSVEVIIKNLERL